ncbi:MAG: nickel pincer cofactor biosynthesis protein LarC [Clostridiaceae bacterium]
MKILYYDCFCGISGDMNLAALIDLGVPKEYLIEELSKLNLNSAYELKIESSAKLGITGTRVDVILKDKLNDKTHVSELTSHGHDDSHDNSNDGNHHDENNHNHHGHHHRNLKDIEEIINSSGLSDKVKKLALNMFMKVAEAEAKVHGKSLYEIHFHEVGAIDSIVDIAGAAICLDYLNVDKIIASPVQVGGGFVKCAHGLMPVPAPATAEILKNIPISTGIVQFETTTPTGAAILAANVEEFTQKVDFSIEKVAYGIGHSDLEIPNVLRVYLGEKENIQEVKEQYILETNIDDMNPELYGYVEEKLFEAGALDVFKTPVFMKKGRPGIKLSVLTNEKVEKDVLNVIFEETTSIGVRKYKVEKIMLDREFSKVKTEYGDITIKKSYYNGKLVKYKPEYEECRTIAKAKKIPINKVYKAIYKQDIN